MAYECDSEKESVDERLTAQGLSCTLPEHSLMSGQERVRVEKIGAGNGI